MHALPLLFVTTLIMVTSFYNEPKLVFIEPGLVKTNAYIDITQNKGKQQNVSEQDIE